MKNAHTFVALDNEKKLAIIGNKTTFGEIGDKLLEGYEFRRMFDESFLVLQRATHEFACGKLTVLEVFYCEYVDDTGCGDTEDDPSPGYYVHQTQYFDTNEVFQAINTFLLRAKRINKEGGAVKAVDMAGRSIDEIKERQAARQQDEVILEAGRVILTTRDLDPFPPASNPFHHDAFHMGTQLPGGWMAMHRSVSDDQDLKYLILINTKTGQRIQLDINKVNK